MEEDLEWSKTLKEVGWVDHELWEMNEYVIALSHGSYTWDNPFST